ncbi:MAG: hypothetical protein OHK0022_48740 [Roseiflexaceae bacterium]
MLKVIKIGCMPWQIALAWFVGLIGVLNIFIANMFSLDQIRSSYWLYIFPFVHTCSFVVSVNTSIRENVIRRKVSWIFIALSSFFNILYFFLRLVFSYNSDVFFVIIFICTILGVALYFPKNAWTIGNIWRIILDITLLAFSTIPLLQGFIYYHFGETDEAVAAANYVIWIGFEVAVLVYTIFLW